VEWDTTSTKKYGTEGVFIPKRETEKIISHNKKYLNNFIQVNQEKKSKQILKQFSYRNKSVKHLIESLTIKNEKFLKICWLGCFASIFDKRDDQYLKYLDAEISSVGRMRIDPQVGIGMAHQFENAIKRLPEQVEKKQEHLNKNSRKWKKN